MSTGQHRILLIVGGGVAAYKALELIRALRKRGLAVRCVLTAAAQQFVTPLAAASLSGDKVYTDLFSLTDEAEMGHIELSRDADLLVVAPATADLMAKMDGGLANDLASTTLLATDKRVLVAPAMNVRMWDHPATRRNVARLAADGVAFVGPDEGEMACGEYGPGRMAEPEAIADAVEALLTRRGEPRLAGRRVVVTSGPTHEPIDPVRYIANRSSGKQGHAIARALAALGAEVTLVSGPVALPDPAGVRTVHVETAREMLAAVEAAMPSDAAVFCAAVADWRTDGAGAEKMKKEAGGGPPALRLVENPDILATVARRAEGRPALVVGFAAETTKVLEHARAKLARKGCDWIVANDVSAATGVMGGDRNTVHLVTGEGVESWPTMDKDAVARALAERIADALKDRQWV
ncbi:bifunctional phosphopantothenoylcysteine decarboxylase/phosphopantothenate--cysteine ligase CoaBC [Alsobacter sp. SYSU M60028]|uniref:Coenzyme A biosynthesis bifunctional protein CoaBC n=1 Tax=Alsobacter ponti TaxID=2962936 RepID=A0ABT1LAT5_9HYPH|nr:bifunctional phosphopantothenoylcysteine decarboxylase/phosphopantothenate--cysteine ligase CoaBC [Alsobacter ponti]MCP8938590.1 bifunctional phosphopantothenoylcysteine decarboxylase/phosphopantothenate--cysteine ligase CoaBC [Alsobacter ponti]